MKPKPSYFDRYPSRPAPTQSRMREILDSHGGGRGISPAREEGPPALAPTPSALEWSKPIVFVNGEGNLISTTGAYEVHKRFTSKGRYDYTARRGLDALGPSRETADEAKRDCQDHFRSQCGE